MDTRLTYRPLAAWAIAGIPVLIAVFQSLLVLFGLRVEDIGLGWLVSPFVAIEVIDEALEVFRDRPTYVVGLFVIIAGAWAAQGYSMFVTKRRDQARYSAGIAALSYFVLYVIAYLPLFDRDLAMVPVLVFFTVPVIVSGLLFWSITEQERSMVRFRSSDPPLQELAHDLKEIRTTFDARFNDRVGELTALSHVAGTGVERARERHDAFHHRLDKLETELDRHLDPGGEPAESEASWLRESVDDLEPEAGVDEIVAELDDHVRSGIRSKFGEPAIRSRYGGRYHLANLPTNHRELRLPPGGEPVRLNELDEVIIRERDRGASLSEIGVAIEAAKTHIEQVEAHIDERESEIANRIDSIRSRIEIVENELGRLDEPLSNKASTLLADGADDLAMSTQEIERELETVEQSLHRCQFDDCHLVLDDLDEAAESLVTTAEFLGGLVGRVEHGQGSMSIPSQVDHTLVERIAPAIESVHACSIRVKDDRVLIEPEGALAEEPAPSSSPPTVDRDEDDTDSTRPGAVIDEVLYVLRELESVAPSGTSERIQYQIDKLPERIGRPEVLTIVAEFVEGQHDLVDEVTLQSVEPPAFLEITLVDNIQPAEAIRIARDRFEERYH